MATGLTRGSLAFATICSARCVEAESMEPSTATGWCSKIMRVSNVTPLFHGSRVQQGMSVVDGLRLWKAYEAAQNNSLVGPNQMTLRAAGPAARGRSESL